MTPFTYQTPGVYRTERIDMPRPPLATGVPAFVGFSTDIGASLNSPVPLDLWPRFSATFDTPSRGWLARAVHGFFANGGRRCYVVLADGRGDPAEALADALAALEPLDDLDLLCAPDLPLARRPGELVMDPQLVDALQAAVVAHCDRLGNRFAILDSLPNLGPSAVLEQRDALIDERKALGETSSTLNGALYYPWLRLQVGAGLVPPCGHIAGVYARTDEEVGVHKAPANETLDGVVDLELGLADREQKALNAAGVNCLRAFPGRGIRVWGARTVGSGNGEAPWGYVNVRRLFLTVGRWVERTLADAVFEPNEPALWARIERELTAYATDLFRRGALKGRAPEEAFYVRCDAGTNPPAERELGRVVTEIGLAPAVPNEFVVVNVVQEAAGATVAEPAAAP